MFRTETAKRFWRWFEGEQAHLQNLIRAAGEPGAPVARDALGPLGEALDQRLADFAKGISAEYALGRDGACVVTFTASGAEDLFEDIFALVDQSPLADGWEFHALRPRNAPATFAAFGVTYALSDLRFYYRLGSDKMVIAVITDETPVCEYRNKRAFATALVSQLLGEEDFGRYVSDVLMLEYETWLSATPGGRSAPLSVLGPTFDRIFRRPQSLRRPAMNTRLRLVS
jgi:hypothetical protein